MYSEYFNTLTPVIIAAVALKKATPYIIGGIKSLANNLHARFTIQLKKNK